MISASKTSMTSQKFLTLIKHKGTDKLYNFTATIETDEKLFLINLIGKFS